MKFLKRSNKKVNASELDYNSISIFLKNKLMVMWDKKDEVR
jgi:hypothetical protein